jgi:UDP-glucose 4-epimerase
MQILITGGSGFIGRNLCAFLKAHGHQVTSFDLKENTLKGILHIKGDVRDAELVKGICQGHDAIVHLAAQVSAPASIDKPEETMAINVEGSRNVLEGAKKGGVKRVVLASSAAVYGEKPTTPTRETTALAPMTPYAESKIKMEELATEYVSATLTTCCLRFFNVYGPGQDPRSQYAAVIPAFITRALHGETLAIYGDGSQTRDFIFIEDLCRAIELALEKGAGAINLATGKKTNITELAEQIILLTGSSSTITHEAARDGDPQESLADIAKAKEELGFEPHIDLETGLKETIDFFSGAS